MNLPHATSASRWTLLAALLGLALAGCSDGAASPPPAGESSKVVDGEPLPPSPPDGHSAASWHQLRDVPADVQLIADIATADAPPGFDFGGLTVWPSQDESAARAAREDRSADFPARAAGEGGGEIPGAVSPEAAVSEAAAWIRRVVRQEYLPVTLPSRLRALADPQRPERSAVYVRYEMGGVAVQIAQTRAAMVIVLRSKFVGRRDAEFGREALRRFYKDQSMARCQMQPVGPGEAELALFRLIPRGSPWYEGARWYTDGQAMAMWLPKRLAGQPPPSPDAPWF